METKQLESLTPDQVAAILSQASGKPVHPDTIASDVREGAPVNPDGSINLVHYTAWLAANVK